MANVVELILKAKDQASAQVGKLSGAFEKLTGISLKTASVMGLVGGAVKGATDLMKESIAETAAYGKQVGDLSRQLGIGAEEASKLIQVTDDLEISQSSLEMAMKTALRQGIVPSIDGITKLAGQYQQLKTPAEKAKFALETFGRSGLEMQKILELSTEEIQAMAEEAENLGLVMSEEGVQSAKDYRLAMDDFNDTLQGLKYTLGTEVIPEVTNFIDQGTTWIQMEMALIEAMKNGNITMGEARGLVLEATFGSKTYADVLEYLRNKMEPVQTSLRGINDLESEHASIVGGEVVPALEDELSQTDLLKESMAGFSAELVFNKAAQELDAQAAIALGQAMGVIDEKTVLLNQLLPGLTAQYDANKNGVIDAGTETLKYGAAVQALYDKIAALDGKTATTYINVVTTQVSGGGGGASGNETDILYEAAGGPVIPGGTYIVGEAGPELLQMGRGGNGYVTPITNNNYNMTINTNARAENVAASFALMKAMA